jgi:hypothetical protein
MSLAQSSLPESPLETARVARAALPRSNPWLHLRAQLGVRIVGWARSAQHQQRWASQSLS